MSTSASCSVVPTGNLQINQTASLQIAISATGTSVQLLNVLPYSYNTSVGASTGANDVVYFGDVQAATPSKYLIPSSSTLTVSIPFYSIAATTSPPYTSGASGSDKPLTTNTTSIGAICYFSDGTTANATETTVTIVAPTQFNGR